MKAKIVLFSALALTAVLTCFGLTKTTSLAIINSTLDNSPVGQARRRALATLQRCLVKVWAPILALVPHAGDSAGYLAFGQGAHGDTDIIAANGGSSPWFEVFYLLGSSLTPEFWLDNNANAHFAGGVASSGGFTGNLSGNVTGNVSGNATTATTTTGNAATASALSNTPSGCGTGYQHIYAIAANGNGSCGTPVYARTTSVNSTAATAGSTANTTLSLQWNFGGTPGSVVMPDTNYAVSCMLIGPSGAPSIQGATKTTNSVTVTIQNGQGSQAVASGASEMDCTVTGS